MSISALVKRCGVSPRSSLLPKTRLALSKPAETFGAELGSTHYESPSQTRWMGPKLPEKHKMDHIAYNCSEEKKLHHGQQGYHENVEERL